MIKTRLVHLHRNTCRAITHHGEQVRIVFEILACVLVAQETHIRALAWVLLVWAPLDILLVWTRNLSVSKGELEEIMPGLVVESKTRTSLRELPPMEDPW